MLRLWLRAFLKGPSITAITDLICNARQELLAARERRDLLSERVWVSALDRLIEMYAEDCVDD